MNLMEVAIRNGVKNTPAGPFLYPYSVRGRSPFSLLTEDEYSESTDGLKSPVDSEDESQSENNNRKDKNIVSKNNNQNKKCDFETNNDESKNNQTRERLYDENVELKSKNGEIEYISREDAFEIQYAKDFEFFFGVPYKPYIRMSKYRFGKNVKYPRDLKQEIAVYKKYPRYIFNDPWPEIDVSKPIQYVEQKQAPKLVNDKGVPISWVEIIERNKRYNIRKGNHTSNDIFDNSEDGETQHKTLGDAVVALEVSSALLNGDLPSIIGEDKKSRKQKRFSFVRDNIRGVAEEIESWTKCPVIQTDISKYLECSWKNIDKHTDSTETNSRGSESNLHNDESIVRSKSVSLGNSNSSDNNKSVDAKDKQSNNDNKGDAIESNKIEDKKNHLIDSSELKGKDSDVLLKSEKQAKEHVLTQESSAQKGEDCSNLERGKVPSKESALKESTNAVSKGKSPLKEPPHKASTPPKKTNLVSSIPTKSESLSNKGSPLPKAPPKKGPPTKKTVPLPAKNST